MFLLRIGIWRLFECIVESHADTQYRQTMQIEPNRTRRDAKEKESLSFGHLIEVNGTKNETETQKNVAIEIIL